MWSKLRQRVGSDSLISLKQGGFVSTVFEVRLVLFDGCGVTDGTPRGVAIGRGKGGPGEGAGGD